MDIYIAVVQNSQGKTQRQKLMANSLTEAQNKLRSQGLMVKALSKQSTSSIKKSHRFTSHFYWQNLQDYFSHYLVRVTVQDKAIFSRQFATLVNSGVTIIKSLDIISPQCPNPKLKKALNQISTDIKTGISLSDSMKKHPDCFDALYISMVQAGEVGGVLDDVLHRLAKLLEDLAKLQNQIKSALSYPIFVGCFAIAIALAMTIFIIPIFANVFKNMGVELPIITKILISFSQTLNSWGFLVIITLIIMGLVAIQQYYKTKGGKLKIDWLFLKIPPVGKLMQKSFVAKFSRTFASLIRSGVPMITSLAIVKNTSGNQVIANAIDYARKDLEKGGMLSQSLNKSGVFPQMAIQMIIIGEETGELDEMLMKIADFYEHEVEQTIKSILSMLEPIMIVLLGGMVATILLAMYLPMFRMFENIG
ncbi:type II secretion system F family protein [Raphidiopsis sp. BLCC-F218]